MRQYSPIAILLLVLGLLASLWTAARRIVVERAGRTVELAVDLEQLRSLTTSVGVPLPEALDALKRAGITSIAVSEQILGELETDGLARVRHAAPGQPRGVTEVQITDPALFRQAADSLRLKLRSASAAGTAGEAEKTPARQVRLLGPGGLEMSAPVGWSFVRNVSIGLPQEDVALVRAHGLELVGRISNFTAADEAAIPAVARRLHEAGAHTVIFVGDEVLGHRTRVKEAAAALDAEGLRYGSVEFGKQMGDDQLSRALEARIVRVHSIQSAELAKLEPDGLIDRFVKAAEERNIRLLYLRLFPNVLDRPFQDNLDTIAAVARGLRARNLRLGIAEPLWRIYPETRSSPAALLAAPGPETGSGPLVGRLLSRLVPAISALAVAAAAVLLLAGLVLLPAGAQTLLALLGSAAVGLMVLGGGNLGRELVALAGAILFPVLAFVWFPVAVKEPGSGAGSADPTATNGTRPPPAYTRARTPGSPCAQFAAISGVSIMGALTVVGLLSERQFMVKVAQFMGIKAAHFLPLLAIALLYAANALGGPRPWPEVRRRAQQRFEQVLGERLQLWHLVAGGAAVVVIGLLLARTGNDPGVGVSGTELSLRNLLDRYLVRPRTKEFLIGHPALLFVLMVSARRARHWIFVPLAVVGAIGQVSLVNSFCHLHTPLLLTVARTFNGLWLGVLIGLLFVRLASRWLFPSRRPSPTTEPAPRAEAGARR